MLIKNMFNGTSMEYTKRCKLRIAFSIGLVILGIISLAAASMYGTKIIPMTSYTEESLDFLQGFYTGTGVGLIAAAVITMIRNMRYLKNKELQKARAVYENDERNRMIGTKCWAYSGYAMFLFLYIGILVGGMISMTVLKVLLCVLGAYGGFLLLFRMILQKVM